MESLKIAITRYYTTKSEDHFKRFIYEDDTFYTVWHFMLIVVDEEDKFILNLQPQDFNFRFLQNSGLPIPAFVIAETPLNSQLTHVNTFGRSYLATVFQKTGGIIIGPGHPPPGQEYKLQTPNWLEITINSASANVAGNTLFKMG